MKKFFHLDSGVFATLTLLYDLIVINLFTVLFCLPVVTAGSSFSAAYCLLFQMEKQPPTLKLFWSAFKKNFSKGAPMTLICLFVGILLIYFVRITIATPIQFLVLLLLAFFCILSMTFFLTIAFDDSSLRKNIQYAVGLTFKYTGYFCLGFSCFALSVALPIFLPKLFFLWLFLGISVPLFIQVKLYLLCRIKLDQIL